MLSVDLNADLGESFGAYTIGMDAQVLPHVTSVNVACGYHAGDPMVMERTVRMAKKEGTAVGAHPGYPDLQGFGRRNMAVSPEDARVMVMYQIGALNAFLTAEGMRMQHVKLHGALYNAAARDLDLALAICDGIHAVLPSVIFLGLAGSQMVRAARETGLRFASEVFADRAYMPDGSLVPRSRPGAVIHDTETAIARTLRMVKEGSVESIDGTVVPLQADSICVHGDNPEAIRFVEQIHRALEDGGVQVRALDLA
ncbi:MAG: LamB/YcsF family protein [Clostridia bacterium]|nr:LamB/YcsF family protein [Clostridia bacterium]